MFLSSMFAGNKVGMEMQLESSFTPFLTSFA